MWRRGANLEGNVANFIETEQLLEFEGSRSSFLQIRGSIPLLWEQIFDLSYKPQLKIIDHEQTSNVVERHFQDLVQRYGETIAVDLTDKHGHEGQLSLAFAAATQNLPNVSDDEDGRNRLNNDGKMSLGQDLCVQRGSMLPNLI